MLQTARYLMHTY